jgi:hypothetical protein
VRTARAGLALTHLEALEAEAIHVIRQVAAELERPVRTFAARETRRDRPPARPVAAGMVEA